MIDTTETLSTPSDAEAEFLRRARSNGWNTTRGGWPDFLIDDARGRLRLVEVKRDSSDVLRPTQIATFTRLERAGVQVLIWTPDQPDRLQPWRLWCERTKKAARRKVSERAGFKYLNAIRSRRA